MIGELFYEKTVEFIFLDATTHMDFAALKLRLYGRNCDYFCKGSSE